MDEDTHVSTIRVDDVKQEFSAGGAEDGDGKIGTEDFLSGVRAGSVDVSGKTDNSIRATDDAAQMDSGFDVGSRDGLDWIHDDIQVGEGSDRHGTGTGVQLSMEMVNSVENDAKAVARSLTALLSSLKSALSEVSVSSVEHMQCHSEAAGLVQAAAIDAATKGNRFVNACLRLNEEMKGVNKLSSQMYPEWPSLLILAALMSLEYEFISSLYFGISTTIREALRQKVDIFEYQACRYLPRQ